MDPAAGRVLFRGWAEQWRTGQLHHAPATVAHIEGNFRRNVYPLIGDRPLAALRSDELQAVVNKLTDSLAPATVRTIGAHLSSCFAAAVQAGRLGRSPWTGVKLPRKVRRDVTVLDVGQVVDLEAAMPRHLAALVPLGVGTGMRIGEATGLSADRVDFLHRVVSVDRQMVTPAGPGVPYLAELKTKASRRRIPAPGLVIDALAAHLASHGDGVDGLLFTDGRKAALRRSRVTEAWVRAVAEVGLPRGTWYHDLRHRYASALIRGGLSVTAVAARLGHSSPTITLEVYAHLWPDDEDRTRSVIDDLFGSAEDWLRTGGTVPGP